MIPSDTSWKIEDTYYIYRKTSENRAELTIEYTIRIIDKMVAHCYEVELLFTSESEGTYKGYDEWESDGKEDSNSLNGNFVVGTGGTQTISSMFGGNGNSQKYPCLQYCIFEIPDYCGTFETMYLSADSSDL